MKWEAKIVFLLVLNILSFRCYTANQLVGRMENLRTQFAKLKIDLDKLKPHVFKTQEDYIKTMDELINKVMLLKNPLQFLEHIKDYLLGTPFIPEREPESAAQYPEITALEKEVQEFITELNRLPQNSYIIDTFIKKIDQKKVRIRPLPPLPSRKIVAETKEEISSEIAKRLAERRKAFKGKEKEEVEVEEEFPELPEIVIREIKRRPIQRRPIQKRPTEQQPSILLTPEEVFAQEKVRAMIEKMRQAQQEEEEEETPEAMWE